MRKVILVICLVVVMFACMTFMGCGLKENEIDYYHGGINTTDLDKMTDAQLSEGIFYNSITKDAGRVAVYQSELNKREIIRAILDDKYSDIQRSEDALEDYGLDKIVPHYIPFFNTD